MKIFMRCNKCRDNRHYDIEEFHISIIEGRKYGTVKCADCGDIIPFWFPEEK